VARARCLSPALHADRNGRFLIDGTKCARSSFHRTPPSGSFFYGVNFELSYNARHWDEAAMPWKSGRCRMAFRSRRPRPQPESWIAVSRRREGADVCTADRIAYNLSKTWALAIEHYADYGGFANSNHSAQQSHALFGVIDYTQTLSVSSSASAMVLRPHPSR